jgi:hypothetical protein
MWEDIIKETEEDKNRRQGPYNDDGTVNVLHPDYPDMKHSREKLEAMIIEDVKTMTKNQLVKLLGSVRYITG